MKRKHLLVPNEFTRAERYTPPVSGGGGEPDPVPERDRVAHANKLLNELATIAESIDRFSELRRSHGIVRDGGLYLQFNGVPDFDLPFESLATERSGIVLLAAKQSQYGDVATIFVPNNKIQLLGRKIDRYQNDEVVGGRRPKNEPLVANIESIGLAQLDALWTDDIEVLPTGINEQFWAEVWFRVDDGLETPDEIRAVFQLAGLTQGQGQIDFPERRVVPVFGNRQQFSEALMLVNSIAELRRVKDTSAFFHAEPQNWQALWVDSLSERIVLSAHESPPRVCLLDTGLNDHPLLVPTFAPAGKQTNVTAWGVSDTDGHGTNMAGLSMFGDLSVAMQTMGPFAVDHQLESVKVLRHGGDNVGQLFGDITREAVARVEIAAPNINRAFVMALSSSDSRDRGRPSTWSAMVDKLTSGADDETRRLFVVCAGNIPRNNWAQYPNSNTVEGVHDPGQSWNALTVGAYTEKNIIDPLAHPNWTLVASLGDLGPSSSTSATWNKWPIKPDVVMEGGNAAFDPAGSVDTVPSLDLLTTNHQFLARPFQLFGDTSGATALAGRFAAQLFAAYPQLWPETVRGLIIHSAEWTQAMLDRFVNSDPWHATKTNVRNLMRHCGFGVPNMESAVWSVENELTLVCQANLQPFDEKLDEDGRRDGFSTKDMNLHLLPWPKEALEELEETEVELRITLSYFVEPNPATRGWVGRYRYQSHGLRFAVKKGSETADQFRHRVNAYARQQEGGEGGTDASGWLIGETTRSHGSVHSDLWRGTARELAERGVLAVYPTIGWWRERPRHERWDRQARYALVVSIRAPTADVDLFASIENQIAIPVEITDV